MSFRLIQTHPAGGDACAPYDVLLDRIYTVEEFINEVLTKYSNEWGYFSILGCFVQVVEYSRGKLKEPLSEEVSSLEIVTVKSAGGWSSMNYRIETL